METETEVLPPYTETYPDSIGVMPPMTITEPDPTGLRTLTIQAGTGGLVRIMTISVGPDTTVVYPTQESWLSSLAMEYSSILGARTVINTITVTAEKTDSSDTPLRSQQTSATPIPSGSATFDDSSSSSVNEPETDPVDTGAIVGGIMGGLAIIGLIIIAMYWIRRRHPNSTKSEDSANSDSEGRGTTPQEVSDPWYELPGAETAPELEGTRDQSHEMESNADR